MFSDCIQTHGCSPVVVSVVVVVIISVVSIVVSPVVSVVVSTGELFSSRKPSTKPNLLAWEVQKSTTTTGAVKFVNAHTKTFLVSTLPTFEVKVCEDGSTNTSDWLLFAKSNHSLIQFTDSFISLDDVWIQNVEYLE